MISKHSDLNKFGGETWHIKIDSLFHIFILDTNQNSFLVELKEWIKWANNKADWDDPLIQKEDDILNDRSLYD